MSIDPVAARDYATNALLRDGGSVHLRAIRPADRLPLVAFFQQLSARSVYFRFFQTKTRLTDSELKYFTDLDFRHHVGLVATLWEGGEEHIIAVGRYICPQGDPPSRAEVAFAVADAHQGRGLGTLLLEHLADIARDQGVTEFEADVLGENNQMLQVFATSGFEIKRAIEGGVLHVDVSHCRYRPLPRRAGRTRVPGHGAKHTCSVPSTLHCPCWGVPAPREYRGGIARQPETVRLPGAIYPVNPHASTLQGLAAFPTVRAIGAPVDLRLLPSRRPQLKRRSRLYPGRRP